MSTSLKDAIAHATERHQSTGKPQVVYESQPGHFLWCSRFAWWNGQSKLTPRPEREIP